MKIPKQKLNKVQKIRILNLDFSSISKQELLLNMDNGVLFTANIDHMIKLQKDEEFYKAYKNAEWVVCDSRVLKLTSFLLSPRIKEVIPGSSFFPDFCNFHKQNNNVKIFLLGAGPGVAQNAMKKINNRIGREIVVGAHSPSYNFENHADECSQIIQYVNKTEATVLVVGVGAPKQEKWIMKYKNEFENIELFMALGATIDFEAGTKKRAPQVLQKLYLEWFYRLMQEPGRLWKRYLIDDIPFFIKIVKQSLGLYKDPFEKINLKT